MLSLAKRDQRIRHSISRAFELLEPRLHFAATQIIGVQSAALDQPRINAYLSTTATGDPLTADFGFETFNITAFFDTGASGVLISDQTAEFLEVPQQNGVIFSDIGVGGSDQFFVSQAMYLSLAKYHPEADVDNLFTFDQVYDQQFGPLRTQIGMPSSNPNPLLEGLDVIGMPAMADKVVVMDPTPVDTFFDTMRTYVYDPGTPFNAALSEEEPGIPVTNTKIPLSYVSFDRFTTVTPMGSPGPTLRNNPFIGRNPFLPGDTRPRPVATYGAQSMTGDWLLDTGAAASIISRARAADLGVTYAPGTYGSENPVLQGISPGTRTFKLTIGGIGGDLTLAGFFMDSLTLPTTVGDGLQYVGAPVLIGDITTFDPVAAQSYTLDGIFGMNYMVATANIIEASPFPIIDDLTEGAFNWIVFDEVNGTLGLDVKGAPTTPRVVDQLFEHDTDPNTYYFQFNRNVGATLGLNDLVVQNLTTGQTVPAGQMSLQFDATLNTATLRFPGFADPSGVLPDGNYRVRVVAAGVQDSLGQQMQSDFVGDFYVLSGDANRDRTVNIDDFGVLASNFNRDPAVWAQGDFNLDGVVNIDDFGILATRFNKTVPPPAAPRAAGATTSPVRLPGREQKEASPFAGMSLIRLIEQADAVLPV